jgi:glycosyltransferase 2 family protein
MPSQPSKWYRQPSFWIGLIISAASIVVLLRLIDIPDLIEKLEQADLRWILIAFALICLTPFIRAARWQDILGPKVGYWKAFHAENIGYLLNVVLPLRAGEPARAYIVSRTQPDVRPVEAMSTVLVARLVDMVSVVLLLGMVLLALDVPDLVRAAGYSMLVLVAAATLVLIIGAYARDRLMGVVRAILTRLLPSALATRLIHWTEDFLGGLGVLRDPRRFALMSITTAALWACYVAFYHLVLVAFWPSPPLAWGALATCAAALSLAVPSSPGAIGVFHFAVAIATAPYLTTDRAAAYAIVVHATETLCQLVFGGYSLVVTGTSLLGVSAAADKLARTPHSEYVP